MKSVCANCNTPILDVARVIMEGCPRCGHKKIIKNRGENYRTDETLMKERNIDENISIFVRGNGEYIINLDNLTKQGEDQPLLVEDQRGRVNILFDDE